MSKKAKTTKRKASTVRHTRAVQRDRSKRPLAPSPTEQVEERLTRLILPATQQQQDTTYRALGLRVRALTLVVMMAFVLSLS